MVKLTKTLKGSTLIEVVVAMVIILTCLGIAITIFTNLSRDVNDELRIQTEIRMNTFATETKFKKDFTDVNLEFENLQIKRSILPYPQKERLKILYLEAFTPLGKRIADYREIISIDDFKTLK